MRKRTGTGGCGGRRLSPEQAQRLGTYGFRPRMTGFRRSEASIKAQTPQKVQKLIPQINLDSHGLKTAYQARRGTNESNVNQHDHLSGENYMEHDTLESIDAVKPPIQSSSVDLGMTSISSTARFANTAQNFRSQKKRVVLRKPKPPVVFKSQTVLPMNHQHDFNHMSIGHSQSSQIQESNSPRIYDR